MLIEVLKNQPLSELTCDTIVIGLYEETPAEKIKTGSDATDNIISQIRNDLPKCAKLGETTLIHTYGIMKAKHLILLGLGKKDALTIEKVRKASASSARQAQKLRSESMAFSFTQTCLDAASFVKAVVEGNILGAYRFQYYKTNEEENKITPLQKLLILKEGSEENFLNAIEEGKIIAASVNFARDLTNQPAKYLTPGKFAAEALALAAKHNLTSTVLEKKEIEEKNMNAFLAVAKGSAEPPKFIALKYEGKQESQEVIAFVGKGITFDSGGISLKQAAGMEKMIGDMAGAATVLGAVAAIAALKLKVNILAVMPCTENMPSGSATKPGDIISSMNGKTIEIVNTDAEGRLILADAVTYAQKEGATHLVDVATLTGACVIALGKVNTGVISNNKDWCGKILAAADAAGENMWELPHNEEYLKQIKSSVADLKNSGGRDAGAITGGLFIGEFAKDVPWAHLDIAGTGDAEKITGYNNKGATGVGVRTLIELAKRLQT